MADHPEQDVVELIYMGVAPSARGHAWGVDITRHGQWLARQAGRRRMVVAVDTANEPALRMYATAGFQGWERRSVYVKAFHRSPLPLRERVRVRGRPVASIPRVSGESPSPRPSPAKGEGDSIALVIGRM